MEREQSYLATQTLGALMGKYAVPCILSLLVGALYNIVDQVFIANASYLGSYGNAANTVVFPLTVIALAIAVMIGDGCCAFVSLSLGKGDKRDAGTGVGLSALLAAASGVLLCAVYLLFAEPILTVFGGTVNEETFALSKEYFFALSLGIPFYVFGQAMNPILRADGSPKFAMATMLSGAILNLILDPIFIFGLHLGMTGAAAATVIGQVVTAVFSLLYLFRPKSVVLSKRSFAWNRRIVGRILSLGLCSFLSQISLVAAMAAINNMIRKYGAADPVFGQPIYAQIPMAVVGIVMKVFQIVISVVIGMAAGCIPIVGYNMGAGRRDRVKRLFSLLLLCEAAVGGIALLAAELLPKALIGIFGSANESAYYTEFAIRAFRIYLSMIVLACLNKATFIFLQAMGKAVASTALSMIREIVFGVGFALLLPLFFGLDGVLYSMPVSDFLTAILSAVCIVSTERELSRAPEAEQNRRSARTNARKTDAV